jgi:hypothetical protein
MCYDVLIRAGERAGQLMDARDAKGAAGASELRQAGIQSDANQRIAQLVNQTTASNPVAAQGAAMGGFVDALRKAQLSGPNASIGGFAPVGGASKRYNSDATNARATAGAENLASADQMARIDAPAYQRQAETTNFNRAATDLSGLDARSRAEAFLLRLRQLGVTGG